MKGLAILVMMLAAPSVVAAALNETRPLFLPPALQAAQNVNPASITDKIIQNPSSYIASLIVIKAQEGQNEPFLGAVDLTACAFVDEELGVNKKEDFLAHLESIAWYYARVSRELSLAGFPSSVWGQSLNTLTAARLTGIIQRYNQGMDLADINAIRNSTLLAESALLQVVNTYKQANGITADIIVSESCGGDWTGMVGLATSPPGGVIKVIREFYFKVCIVSKISPYSNSCDRWSVVSNQTQIPQGVYHYIVQWQGAAPECDRIELITSEEEDEPIITIPSKGTPCPQ